jgi:exosortase
MRRHELAWIGMLALVFAPAMLALVRVWSSVDYYSQGFLIPVVSYLSFRKEARGLGPPRRDPRGAIALGVAFALYAFGLLDASVTLQGLSVVLAVAAVVLHTWGLPGLRRLAFPVGFLLFMVPIPAALLTPIIVWLQLQVTVISVDTLHAMGFTVLRAGNVVLLPGGASLFVAEACSGITSIVTLLPLGLVLAHYLALSPRSSLLLAVVVVPVAMFGNFLRVLGTVAAAQHYGVDRVASGPIHEFSGLVVFVLECAVLIALVPLIRRLLPGGPSGTDAAHPA